MKTILQLAGILLVFCSAFPQVHAQHLFDILVQDVDDRVAIGSADQNTGIWTIGARSFAGEFDSSYAVNNPGWNTFGIGSPDMPAGAEALPVETDLEWDFLPMKIDGLAANLYYWDGSGSVAFGALPGPNYELSMQSKTAGFIPVDGSPTLVPGEIIETTSELGAIHEHRFFFIDDFDDDSGTAPADGIYLFSMRPRVSGLDRSKPMYFVFGTPGSTTLALTDAQAWVDTVLDDLAPDFSADFDGDLDVDGDDLAILQQGYETTGSTSLQENGDADYNDVIDGADFLVWQRQQGSDLSTFAGATSPTVAVTLYTVPEPSALTLVFGFLITMVQARR